MSTVQRAPRLAPPAVPAARTAPVRRTPLRAVPTGAGIGARRAARGPFVLLVGLLLSAGLIGLLLLNTALGQGSFALHDLNRRADQLDDQAQALQRQLAKAESPAQLAVRAQALGMVPSENPAFVRAADGKVLGVPKPGQAPPATAAPQSAAPKSAAPKSAAPKSAAPKSAAPKSAAPKSSAPKKSAPSNGSTKPAATGASSATGGSSTGTLG
jgi:outer membrane biosynthesis protein TonB